MNQIKDIFQDCNINFLLGSGMSRPFLPTLGTIEALLTELGERETISRDTARLIRASIYKKYFDAVIKNNVKILAADAETDDVRTNYRDFLKAVNSILLKRKSTILSKSVNVFTTNVDIFLDQALEDLKLEYNDGFSGRFRPTFNLGNFKKSHFTKSSHYDNTSELPVFNLLKLHGSLSWALNGSDVMFASDLAHLKEVEARTIHPDHVLSVSDDATIESLLAAAAGRTADASTDEFLAAYERLLIVVNPTKEKFKHTLMNQTYYEMLRLYSNELEKENTTLFVMGFSFADEHICEITLRSANANPTLIVYVVAYDAESHVQIAKRLGSHPTNSNIKIIAPAQDAGQVDKFKYDFAVINQRIFGRLMAEIAGEEVEAPEGTAKEAEA